jgi:hypothetical protein
VEIVEGTRFVTREIALLGEILARRDPALVDLLERLDSRPIGASDRERIRRAIVDELCELPGGAGRRALELEDLLIHLGRPDAA